MPVGLSRRSLVIGRVAGIPIRLHPTFLLVLLLVVISVDPLSLTGSLLVIFGSVTVHELGHALVARRRGVEVRDILLLPIGGVSELERLPDRPADQLEVAVAGPVTSLALGVLGLALAGAGGAEVWPVDLVHGSLLHRFGWLNLILAAFNLLPALPLDGGRVLRALLVPRVGEVRSTVIAAGVGRAIAIGMITIGVFADLWLVIIGFFVLSGAMAEEANARLKGRLDGLVARDLMRPVHGLTMEQARELFGADVVTIDDDEPASDATADIARSRGGRAVVVHDGRPIGVVRLLDVQQLLSSPPETGPEAGEP